MLGERHLVISELKIWVGVFSCNGIRHGLRSRLYRIAFQQFTVTTKDYNPIPPIMSLHSPLMKKTFHSPAKPYAHNLVDFEGRWLIKHGQWVIGGGATFDYINKLFTYTLKNIAHNNTCDVLVLSGENDMFKSFSQDEIRYFNNARSFTRIEFKDQYGAAYHCQAGAVEQALLEMFKWLETNNLQ